MSTPRELPLWLKIILNVSGPAGVGLTLLGIINASLGFFCLGIGVIYIGWELYPKGVVFVKRSPFLSLPIFMLAGSLIGGCAWLILLKAEPSTSPASLPVAPQPFTKGEDLSPYLLYGNKKLEVHNGGNRNIWLWGFAYGNGSVATEKESTLIAPGTFYFLSTDDLESKLMDRVKNGENTELPCRIFITAQDSTKETIRCTLYINRSNDALQVNTRVIDIVAGWLTGEASSPSPSGTVLPAAPKPSGKNPPETVAEPKSGKELVVSIVGAAAPSIVVDNQTDDVAEGIRWELVMFRTTDQKFFSYASQDIGYLKAHSKSNRYIMNLNSIPQAPDGGGAVANGESFIGTLSVDCPSCLGTSLVVSFVWGSSGWFYQLPGGKGKLLLPKDLSKDAVSRFISYVTDLVKPGDRIQIQ